MFYKITNQLINTCAYFVDYFHNPIYVDIKY